MSYLLNLAYLVLLICCAPWLAYRAFRTGRYRQGWRQKLWGDAPVRSGEGPCIWLHAVSVGEVNLIQPLIQRLERRLPACQLAISTTTQTGFELAQRKYSRHLVFYCPLDFSWAVRRALWRLRPQMIVLAELELWPNLIRIAKQQGIAVAVVNGRLSSNSFRGYAKIAPLIRRTLAALDLIAAQNQQYAERFIALGAWADRVHLAGSLKFDGAETDRQNPRTRELAELAGIAPHDIVFLAGSTQHPEEAMALESFQTLQSAYPNLRLIITPRHPERFAEVAALLDRCGQRWQRRSNLESGLVSPPARILLVDVVGELGAWWGTSHIAFVGGSMGRRQGQNMIEPAAYGAAVCFGPCTQNFRDVVSLLLEGNAAMVVQDGKDLTAFLRKCLEEPAWARQLGEQSQRLVISQLGAADRTTNLLVDLLHQQSAKPKPYRRAA